MDSQGDDENYEGEEFDEEGVNSGSRREAEE
jgi:hypothetical protein